MLEISCHSCEVVPGSLCVLYTNIRRGVTERSKGGREGGEQEGRKKGERRERKDESYISNIPTAYESCEELLRKGGEPRWSSMVEHNG